MNKKYEHYKKVMAAEIALERRIQERDVQERDVQESDVQERDKEKYWTLIELLGCLCQIIVMAWGLLSGISPLPMMLAIMCFIFPFLYKFYSLIIGISTVFSGFGLFFSAPDIITPVFPFTIANLEISYFLLGLGLIKSSRKKCSILGLLLGVSYASGGILGLFKIRNIVYISISGSWGAIASNILVIGLGGFMTYIILSSWRKPKLHRQSPGHREPENTV